MNPANPRVAADQNFSLPKTLDRLTDETRAAVEKAAIILLPNEGFRDFTEPMFPGGTVELFRHLREHAPEGTSVEIAIEDQDYKELVLHSNVLQLAMVIVDLLIAPVAAQLIANYITARLGSRSKDTPARASLIVDRKDGTAQQAMRISYEGPADTFEQSVKTAIQTFAQPVPASLAPAAPAPGPEQTVEPQKLLKPSQATKKKKRRK